MVRPPSGQLPARACACACAALLLLPAAALAEVLSVAGDVIHATPPEPSLAAGNNRSPTAWAFVDYPRFGVDVTTPGSDRLYGEIPVGRWGAGAMPPPDVGVSVGPTDLFTSHVVHVDNAEEGPRRYRGVVTFDAEIVAIFVTDEALTASDLSTALDFSDDTGRGTEVFSNDTEGDVVERMPDGLTVRFDVRVDGEDRVDQIRVITRGESPEAEVSMDCPIEVRVEGTTVSLRGTIRNEVAMERVEPSLPVDLVGDWVPDLATPPSGQITFDGAVLSCVGTEGVLTRCPLGRVAPGAHEVLGQLELAPGTTTSLRVGLLGPDVVSGVCEIPIRVPNAPRDGGGPGLDGGPSDPSAPAPRFGGGGGARCGAVIPGAPGLVPLAVLFALGLLGCRRR